MLGTGDEEKIEIFTVGAQVACGCKWTRENGNLIQMLSEKVRAGRRKKASKAGGLGFRCQPSSVIGGVPRVQQGALNGGRRGDLAATRSWRKLRKFSDRSSKCTSAP